MLVKGSNCTVTIRTQHRAMDVPYSEETIREAVSLLHEEAPIEGDGINRAIRKSNGVTGCVVTPLTIGTAPLLLYLAMGVSGCAKMRPVFVSETRDLYQYRLNLLPIEDADCFDLIQDRAESNERRLYESCGVKEFELRIIRDETIKMKLDFTSERSPVVYSYTDRHFKETGERFSGENVGYLINGKEYTNIYGLTLAAKKEGGTRTELWIRRILNINIDLPQVIDELTITARLLRDKYEERRFGMFRITVKGLVLTSDETNVNSVDTVIGPLRYYVSGAVFTEVFNSGEAFL